MSFASSGWPATRDRLLADALHQVAVGGEHVGMVIDDVAEIGRQHPLRERHANRGREPLAQRSGRRLDAERVAIFGMTWRLGAELAEAPSGRRWSGPSRRRRRSGKAANRAASSHGRPTEQSGRDRANADRRRRISGTSRNRTVAMSAAPIGRPGWPLLAFSTASTARKDRVAHRIVRRARRHGRPPSVALFFRAAPRPPASRARIRAARGTCQLLRDELTRRVDAPFVHRVNKTLQWTERWSSNALKLSLSGSRRPSARSRRPPSGAMRLEEARPIEEEFALMQDDRARLAVDLDASLDRSRALEAASVQA